MSLPIKYYNPYSTRYTLSDNADDANEATDGTVYLNSNEVVFGNGSGHGIDSSHAFFRYEIPTEDATNLQDKRVLPDTSLVIPFTEYWDFPWSGRLYCELTPSSVPLDGSVSGISTRTKTTAYCDIDHTDFELVRNTYNDDVYGYWSLHEGSGLRKNTERFNTDASTPFFESGSVPGTVGINGDAAVLGGGNFLHASGFNFDLPSQDTAVSFYLNVEPTTVLNEYERILTVNSVFGERYFLDCVVSGDDPTDTEIHFRLNGTPDANSYVVGSNFTSGEWIAITVADAGKGSEVYGDGTYVSGQTLAQFRSLGGSYSLGTANDYQHPGLAGNTLTTIEIGGGGLDCRAESVLLWSGDPNSLDSLYDDLNLERIRSTQYPLINGEFGEAPAYSYVKSALSYRPFAPVQEVLDAYGSGLSTISFIYEHLEGSGHSPIRSYDSGIAISPSFIGSTDFELAVSEKTGEPIPDTPENSGLLMYWDMHTLYDRINCTPLFNSTNSNIGIQPVGGVFQSGTVGTYTILKPVFNEDDRDTFIYQSSIHPQGDQSYVFWRNYTSDYYPASMGGITKYINTDLTLGLSNVSFSHADFGFTDYSGLLILHQGATVRSTEWVERHRQSMTSIVYNSDVGGSPKIGSCHNGNDLSLVNASVMSEASGDFRFGDNSYASLWSDVRVYDRALGNREIKNIYNGAFPSRLNNPSPKVQYMYPMEDRMGHTVQDHAPILMHNVDAYFEHLEGTDDGNFQNPEGWGHTWGEESGKFFSAINQWHSAFENPSGYLIYLNIKDNTAITPYNTNQPLKFGLGAAGVKPSAVVVHFEAAAYYSQGTMHTIHHSGYTPGGQPSIDSVYIVDKNKDLVTVNYNNGFNIDHSGFYDVGENFIHYTSGLELDPDIDERDLSDLEIVFNWNDTGTNPGFGMLHGVAVEIQGEVNIAHTGLDLYTNAVLATNSGIDLYTVARDSQNSGMDLYTEGMIVNTSSVPMYTISADFENSGIDLYTYGRDSANSGMTLITNASDTIFTFRPTLYMSGIGRPTDSLDLSVWGRDSENSGMDLNIWGHIAENSGMDLWVEGVEIDNGSIPFFAEATVSYDSGGFPLYVNSTANTSLYKARPMYIEVNAEEMGTGGMPMFLNSVTAGSGDQYMPFFLDSDPDRINNGTDMYLKNAFESGHKSQFLYVRGLGNLDGGAVDNGSMPLFIERVESYDRGMSMFLSVDSGSEQGLGMYTYGGTWSTSGVELSIPSTLGLGNSGLDIYVNGF